MTQATARAAGRARPTRRAQRAQPRGDRTRQEIIDETVRCVREEGFGAASANHIAERAGVTWGVIQYHFGDRSSLLLAVIDHGFGLLRAAIARVEVPTGSVRQRVEAVVDAAWEAFIDPASLAALEILVATRAERDPKWDRRLAELGQQLSRLGRVIEGGSADRPSTIGDLLWAALRGLVLVQMIMRSPVDFRRERAALIEVLTARLESGGASARR